MKDRIVEIIDGNGSSVFVPQFFNEYKGWKIFKFFVTFPNQWLNYTNFGKRMEFETIQEARKFLKGSESSRVIHEL
jgi:hypothetical protein